MTNTGQAFDAQAFMEHLDAQLDMLIRQNAAFEALSSAGTATDPTGTITVEFGLGAELQAITVAPQWTNAVPPEEFVTVVTETLVRARGGGEIVDGGQPLADAEVAAIRERRLAEARARQQRRTPEEMAAVADSLPASLDELNRRASEAIEQLRAMEPQITDGAPGEVETVQYLSDNQMVGVEYVAGMPVRVSVKPSWLAKQSGITITECFAEAIRAAHGATGDH